MIKICHRKERFKITKINENVYAQSIYIAIICNIYSD